MPRDGSGIYTLPFPDVVTNTTIASAPYNGFEHDIATDLNAARPIIAGGTGGTSALAARNNLVVETYGQVITNYDSATFFPGSFYSAAGATGAPNAHAFVGICAYVDANNMFLEAYDRDDTSQPGALWVRQKKAGVWSSWVRSGMLVNGTPTANQFTTWQNATTLQGVTITGLVKGNGASAPSAAVASTDYATPSDVTTAAGLRVAKSGDTMTGDLLISKANPSVSLSKAATSGQDNAIFGKTSGLNRWHIDLGDSGNESGSNSGSDFNIGRYNDAGSFIATAFTINRASGAVAINGNAPMTVAGNQTVTGGFRITPSDQGTKSSGTFTPDAFNHNYQYYTNNGAHTLAAPVNDCAMDILVTNGASAGAITFSGFTVSSAPGDPMTTTSGHKFIISIRRINGTSTYIAKALQ